MATMASRLHSRRARIHASTAKSDLHAVPGTARSDVKAMPGKARPFTDLANRNDLVGVAVKKDVKKLRISTTNVSQSKVTTTIPVSQAKASTTARGLQTKSTIATQPKNKETVATKVHHRIIKTNAKPAKESQQLHITKVLKPVKPAEVRKVAPVKVTKVPELRVPPLPQDVPDHDAEVKDYLAEPTYAQDIMTYLRQRERQFKIPVGHLKGTNATPKMRTVVVDWLTQVQNYLRLQQDTLQLTVTYFDMFLSRRDLACSELQLLAVACLSVAAKFGERFAPEVRKLAALTDHAYTKAQILRMEIRLLKELDLDVNIPEPTVFLSRFIKVDGNSWRVHQIARYLLDLALTSSDLAAAVASQKAAAAMCLARHLLASDGNCDDDWSNVLEHYTGYTRDELLPVMRAMFAILQKAPTSASCKGAFDKYRSSSRHDGVALWICVNQPDLNL